MNTTLTKLQTNADTAARAFRNYYEAEITRSLITGTVFINSRSLAEALNITIIEDAYIRSSSRSYGKPVSVFLNGHQVRNVQTLVTIHIPAADSPERKNWLIASELHNYWQAFVRGGSLDTFICASKEEIAVDAARSADYFASSLLLPRQEFLEYLSSTPPRSLIELRKIAVISPAILKIRLQVLNCEEANPAFSINTF